MATGKPTGNGLMLLSGGIFLLSISFSVLHWFAAYFGQPPAYVFRSTHLSIVLLLVFLKALNEPRSGLRHIESVLLIAASLFIVGTQAFYILADPNAIYDRPGSLTPTDVWIGSIYLFLVLEATRRMVGWALVVVALFFIVNSLVAEHMFWIFYGPSVGWDYLVEIIFFTSEGLFTTPLGAMASYIVLFIIFGSVLAHTGAQSSFISLAMAAVGGRVGGPAKAAVVASGMLGTISGSAVANVMTTGSITVPLMKRLGYKRGFAGAVEAASSSGGQVMPPVMGATAFIMAEFLQLPYTEIALAALIPAMLYYASLYCMVHFESRLRGLKPVPSNQLPALGRSVLQAGPLLITIGSLIGMLMLGTSIARAGAIAIAVAIVASLARPHSRMAPRNFLVAMKEAADIALPISLACAVAGVIIGAAFTSGTATRLTVELMAVGQTELWMLLVVTMFASFLLGMGLTTSADYILLVTLAVPAIVAVGVAPLAAHIFVFYFASFSGITPPVALASFAAASLSGASLWRTGLLACKIGVAAFLVPYMVIYRPGILLEGDTLTIVRDTVVSLVGVVSLAASAQGWFIARLDPLRRAGLFVTAVLLIGPIAGTDLVGGVLLTAIVALQLWSAHRSREAVPRPEAAAAPTPTEGAGVEELISAVVGDASEKPVALDQRYIVSWLPVLAIGAFVWWANSIAWHVRDFSVFLLSLTGVLAVAALVLFYTPVGGGLPYANRPEARS